MVEATTNYWVIRVRDPDSFETIRTPEWANYAATIMAKKWLLAESTGDNPRDIETPRVAKINFINNHDEETSVYARQGRSQDEWYLQSILIPKRIEVEGEKMDLPPSAALGMADYIKSRLK